MKPFTKKTERTQSGITIHYRVGGFWSRSQIDVRQTSEYWNTPQVWGKVDITRSTGGSDGGSAKELIDAESNFAAALLDAVNEARKLLARVGKPVGKKAPHKIYTCPACSTNRRLPIGYHHCCCTTPPSPMQLKDIKPHARSKNAP